MLSKRQILIVDDEPEIREIIRENLETEFPDKLVIQEVGNGHDALQRIQRQKYDLVITDIRMPKKDGVSLINSTANMAPAIKPRRFVVVSGHGAPQAFSDRIGQVSFLAKPIEWEELFIIAREVIEGDQTIIRKPERKQFAVEYVKAFIDSTLIILDTYAHRTATKESINVAEASRIEQGDISALIAMNTSQQYGTLSMTFDSGCFLDLAAGVSGVMAPRLTEEHISVAGEICFQVYESVRRQLHTQGFALEPAIPMVVMGAKHQVFHATTGHRVVIEFKTEKGSFWLDAVTRAKARGE